MAIPYSHGRALGSPGQVAIPLAERGQEGIGSDLVGGFGAQPPFRVPVHLGEVPVEDDREALRPGQRLGDDRGVVGPADDVRAHLVIRESHGCASRS